MISFRSRGDFSKTSAFFKNARNSIRLNNLDKYAKEGLEALKSATPIDTGRTAGSWYYKIERTNGSVAIKYCNTNVQDGVPIAIILQYGHGTGNGGWVEGRDYINPAIRPHFDKIAKAAWEEVTKS